MELIKRCTSCGHLQHDGACYGPHEQEYRKRKAKIEPCGHETNFQIGDDHGNLHCLMCENNELRAALGKREKEYRVASETEWPVGSKLIVLSETFLSLKKAEDRVWFLMEENPENRNVHIQWRFADPHWEDM